MGNLVWLEITDIFIGYFYSIDFNVCVHEYTLKYTESLEYSSEILTCTQLILGQLGTLRGQ